MATHRAGEIFLKRFPVCGLSCVVAVEAVLGTSADKSIVDGLDGFDPAAVAVVGA